MANSSNKYERAPSFNAVDPRWQPETQSPAFDHNPPDSNSNDESIVVNGSSPLFFPEKPIPEWPSIPHELTQTKQIRKVEESKNNSSTQHDIKAHIDRVIAEVGFHIEELRYEVRQQMQQIQQIFETPVKSNKAEKGLIKGSIRTLFRSKI